MSNITLDHLFSAVFWMYNCLNVVTFHYFWKMQSDVWALYRSKSTYLTTAKVILVSTLLPSMVG